MSIGILSIAWVPGYASIGLIAPLLVVFGRLLRGFSAGMELSAVSVYLSEIATPGRKGFYVSWQSVSQQVVVMFAALLGMALNSYLSPAKITLWGWPIPLLIGCIIFPFLLRLRRSLKRDGRVCCAQTTPKLCEDCSHSEPQCSIGARWHHAVHDDDRVFLHAYDLHSHVWQYRASFG
jgi:MFS family permease